MEDLDNTHLLHQLFFAKYITKNKMEDIKKSNQIYGDTKGRNSRRIYTTKSPMCLSNGERQCEDGTCIARVELCPEEQLMNQNTILIMIVVGLAVVVFLVILYCFQQRQRRANQALGTDSGLSDDDCDNASLYAPPPSYEDVMSSNLYLPTAEHRRLQMLSTADETLTPPPNYDTALILLAQSQDSALNKLRRSSSVLRRSVSMENENEEDTQNRNSVFLRNDSRNSKKNYKKKNIFRYSGRFTQTSVSSENNSASPRSFQRTLPPYSPPIYPITPPPPMTPIPTSVHTQFILPGTDRRLSQTVIQESSNENDVIS